VKPKYNQTKSKSVSSVKGTMIEKPPVPARGVFTILHAVDRVAGDAKTLQIAQPGDIHFPNAKGGLRAVDGSDIRGLAKSSATRLAKALA
jgi:hypothetical protein